MKQLLQYARQKLNEKVGGIPLVGGLPTTELGSPYRAAKATLAFGLLAPVLLPGCKSYESKQLLDSQEQQISSYNPDVKVDIRVIGGNRSSTLDARVLVNTPIKIAGKPLKVFVRDRLTGSYGSRKQKENSEKLKNFAVTDLVYPIGKGVSVLAGSRSVATWNTEKSHDSTGRIDLRVGGAYKKKIGDATIFIQPTAIIDPRKPKIKPQGEIVTNFRYDFDPGMLELENVTRYAGKGVEQVIGRGSLHMSIGKMIESESLENLTIGPGFEIGQTKAGRKAGKKVEVNAGGVLRFSF